MITVAPVDQVMGYVVTMFPMPVNNSCAIVNMELIPEIASTVAVSCNI
jgi:hypothetical protein